MKSKLFDPAQYTMGACCPKLNKSQSYLSMADSDAPLLPGGGTPNGTLGGGRSVPNGTLDSSKDADERAVYTKIIDDTQTQVSLKVTFARK